MAVGGHQEGDRLHRHFFGVGVRYVADQDPALAGGGDVDIVVADVGPQDDAAGELIVDRPIEDLPAGDEDIGLAQRRGHAALLIDQRFGGHIGVEFGQVLADAPGVAPPGETDAELRATFPGILPARQGQFDDLLIGCAV